MSEEKEMEEAEPEDSLTVSEDDELDLDEMDEQEEAPEEEIKEAVIFWLSMSKLKSNTETCNIASILHNDNNAEVIINKDEDIIKFSEEEKIKDL